MTPPTRVLVLGAGYAGLLFTMRLAGQVPARKVSITPAVPPIHGRWPGPGRPA
jgi:hypothetical protein